MRIRTGTSAEVRLPGATVRFKADEPEYAVVDARVDPGFAPSPHIHRRQHEVVVVLEGRIDFLLGDETQRVVPGGVVDIPRGVVHDFHNPGPDPARVVSFSSPGGLPGYLIEVEEHARHGTLDVAVLAGLRDRYDSRSIDLVWRLGDPGGSGA